MILTADKSTVKGRDTPLLYIIIIYDKQIYSYPYFPETLLEKKSGNWKKRGCNTHNTGKKPRPMPGTEESGGVLWRPYAPQGAKRFKSSKSSNFERKVKFHMQENGEIKYHNATQNNYIKHTVIDKSYILPRSSYKCGLNK